MKLLLRMIMTAFMRRAVTDKKESVYNSIPDQALAHECCYT